MSKEKLDNKQLEEVSGGNNSSETIDEILRRLREVADENDNSPKPQVEVPDGYMICMCCNRVIKREETRCPFCGAKINHIDLTKGKITLK